MANPMSSPLSDLFNPISRALKDRAPADKLAQTMAQAYEQMAAHGRPVLRMTWDHLTAGFSSIPLPAIPPLQEAGRCIATAMDSGLGAGTGNGYHNTQHTFEVLMNADVLARLEGRHRCTPVSSLHHLMLLTSALIHDLDHDGKTNNGQPFRLEQKALNQARPYLERAGATPAVIEGINLMVLTTDPSGAHRFAGTALTWHMQGGTDRTRPDLPEHLAPLAPLLSPKNFVLCEVAAMLRDADVLSSAGLTPSWTQVQNDRLSREWGRPSSPEGYRFFLNAVLGHSRPAGDPTPPARYENEGVKVGFSSRAGQFFDTNIPVIEAAVCG